MTPAPPKQKPRVNHKAVAAIVTLMMLCSGCGWYDGENAAEDSVELINKTDQDLVIVKTRAETTWQEALVDNPSGSSWLLRPDRSNFVLSWTQDGSRSDTYCISPSRVVHVLVPEVPIETESRNTSKLLDGYTPDQFSLYETYDATTLCAEERRATHDIQ